MTRLGGGAEGGGDGLLVAVGDGELGGERAEDAAEALGVGEHRGGARLPRGEGSPRAPSARARRAATSLLAARSALRAAHGPFGMTGCDLLSPGRARRRGRCGRSRRRRPTSWTWLYSWLGALGAGARLRRRRRSAGRSPRRWRRLRLPAASTMPRSRARRSARPAAAAGGVGEPALGGGERALGGGALGDRLGERLAALGEPLGQPGLLRRAARRPAGRARPGRGRAAPAPASAASSRTRSAARPCDASAAARSARRARTRSAGRVASSAGLRLDRGVELGLLLARARPRLASRLGAAGADRGLVGLLALRACPGSAT